MRVGSNSWALGIDVSKYQGVIDWPTVAKVSQAQLRPITFVWIRLGIGDQVDPQFARNWDEAQAAGIIVGAYYAAWPGVHSPDPQTDAQYAAALCFNTLDHVGGIQLPQMGIVLDWEVNLNHWHAAQLDLWGQHWMEDMRAGIPSSAKFPGIYVDPAYWATHRVTFAQRDPWYWIADWGLTSPSTLP